jgi:hypothetical protein
VEIDDDDDDDDGSIADKRRTKRSRNQDAVMILLVPMKGCRLCILRVVILCSVSEDPAGNLDEWLQGCNNSGDFRPSVFFPVVVLCRDANLKLWRELFVYSSTPADSASAAGFTVN